MENPEQLTGLAAVIVNLLPLCIMTLPIIIMNYNFSKRKGKNPVLWAALSIFPFINVLFMVYLISLTDMVVINELREIK